jgi:hypothetical protein
MITSIVQLLFGLAVLTAGRKLYWLFVGVVGFSLGMILATLFFPSESELVLLVIALAAGMIGAILALLLQRLAVGMAGFLAGGYILTNLFEVLGWATAWPYWLLFLIGGVISAVFVTVLFDWALILLSSWMGASLLVQIFPMPDWLRIFLYIFLMVIGIGVQAAVLRKEAD